MNLWKPTYVNDPKCLRPTSPSASLQEPSLELWVLTATLHPVNMLTLLLHWYLFPHTGFIYYWLIQAEHNCSMYDRPCAPICLPERWGRYFSSYVPRGRPSVGCTVQRRQPFGHSMLSPVTFSVRTICSHEGLSFSTMIHCIAHISSSYIYKANPVFCWKPRWRVPSHL